MLSLSSIYDVCYAENEQMKWNTNVHSNATSMNKERWYKAKAANICNGWCRQHSGNIQAAHERNVITVVFIVLAWSTHYILSLNPQFRESFSSHNNRLNILHV